MQSGGVKVGEKLYLPGLPVCFCKQIARSNENGSKIENQELLGKQKVSNATTRNAQSITFVCPHNEKFIMPLSLQVHGYIFSRKKKREKKPNITNPTIRINLQQGFWKGRRWVWLRSMHMLQGEQGTSWAQPRLQHSSTAFLCLPTLSGQEVVLGTRGEEEQLKHQEEMAQRHSQGSVRWQRASSACTAWDWLYELRQGNNWVLYVTANRSATALGINGNDSLQCMFSALHMQTHPLSHSISTKYFQCSLCTHAAVCESWAGSLSHTEYLLKGFVKLVHLQCPPSRGLYK